MNANEAFSQDETWPTEEEFEELIAYLPSLKSLMIENLFCEDYFFKDKKNHPIQGALVESPKKEKA